MFLTLCVKAVSLDSLNIYSTSMHCIYVLYIFFKFLFSHGLKGMNQTELNRDVVQKRSAHVFQTFFSKPIFIVRESGQPVLSPLSDCY